MGYKEPMHKEKYENLDGIRGYASIGIVLMHVLANGNNTIHGVFFEKVIPSSTNLTYLFMILSAFSMCCGYYDKFASGKIDLERFYSRRYQRVWPFFVLLCTIELILNRDLNSLYEWLADITLAFGLIQNHKIGVVGVGWFLGVVFVFYMVFPFFVFLLKQKKTAWIMLVVSIMLNVLCNLRFTEAADRANFVYSAMFFTTGGLLYLYRKRFIALKAKWLYVIVLVGTLFVFYGFSGSDYVMLVLFSLLTIIGITSEGIIAKKVFQNRTALFCGSISMEVYLCHMFVYRLVERVNIANMIADPVLSYFAVSISTFCGAIIVSIVLKKGLILVEERFFQRT